MSINALAVVLVTEHGVFDVLDGRLTLDETWSPYLQGDVTIATPSNLALSHLDPRDLPGVTIGVATRFGDPLRVEDLTAQFSGLTVAALTAAWAGAGRTVADLTRELSRVWDATHVGVAAAESFNLDLRERRVSSDGTTQLTLAGPEQRLQDYAHATSPQHTFAASAIHLATSSPIQTGVIDEVLVQVYGTPVTLLHSRNGESFLGGKQWRVGVTADEVLRAPIANAGLRLWVDERSRWRLDPAGEARPDGLRLDERDNLRWEETITRDDADWFDGYAMVPQTPTASTALARYAYYGDRPTKVKVVTFDETLYPALGADAAWGPLERAHPRAVGFTIDAMIDPRTRPGMSIELATSRGTYTGRIQAVTFDFGGARMTLTVVNLEEPE